MKTLTLLAALLCLAACDRKATENPPETNPTPPAETSPTGTAPTTAP